MLSLLHLLRSVVGTNLPFRNATTWPLLGAIRTSSRHRQKTGLREVPMKVVTLAVAICLISAPAFASCKSEAAEKKLAGAALKSFMTKCEKDAKATCAKDAQAACEKDATDKTLRGAAKASHMKKCVADAAKTAPVEKCVLDTMGM